MAWFDRRWKTETIPADQALPGRDDPITDPAPHIVSGNSLTAIPDGHDVIYFAMGCFWGAERLFWETPGVYSTAVGYQGGHTPNANYSEVCSGGTGHTEAVRVVYDPAKVSLDDLLKVFWEGHDPTQGMRQGNDVGTQYRSAIYWITKDQQEVIEQSAAMYAGALDRAGRHTISTEIREAPPFYYAEEAHQQYLAKNPGGYCGLGGTGVSCPMPAPAG